MAVGLRESLVNSKYRRQYGDNRKCFRFLRSEQGRSSKRRSQTCESREEECLPWKRMRNCRQKHTKKREERIKSMHINKKSGQDGYQNREHKCGRTKGWRTNERDPVTSIRYY